MTNWNCVYFFLGETLERYGIPEKKREALPFYERLVNEYEQSEHLEETRRRIDRLKLELKLEPTPPTTAER